MNATTVGVSTPIPILVLSYNDLPALRLCLRALVNRTHRAYELIVVDNASTDLRLRRYLEGLAHLTRIRVHRNKANLWVLGLNAPLRAALAGRTAEDLFAITDCDIIVPPPRGGLCWLSRLEAAMAVNASVGKLGLSLDTGYIEARPQFSEVLRAERFFMSGPRLGELIVAGVDTTMALYRQSLFVTRRPRFLPGHQSLHRPHFYCCRTPATFRAKHLSWRGYASRSEADIAAKLVCMALVGAEVTPVQRASGPLWARAFYAVFRPMAKLGWGLIVAALQAVYLLRRFPRGVNELQHSRRGPRATTR